MPWADARRVLAVRLDSIGDVLMTTPALHALRATVPGRTVTLLTSPAGAALAPLLPDVDDVIVYEAPWMKATAARRTAAADYALAGALRRGRFDAAAIFTVYSQSPLPAAVLCHLAGIPLRLAHCRENPYQLLTDWVREPEPERLQRHEVRRQLDLVATVGAHAPDDGLRLRIPDAARAHAGDVLDALGLDAGDPWAVIHPGATAPSRRYPAERFADVARLLVDAGVGVLFTGGAAEAAVVDGIRAAARVPTASLAGRLGLAELAATIARAPVVIANNSGPAHIAAAVGTPVVDLYALTNPQHTPWTSRARVLFHDVACRWCYRSVCPEGHHACLRNVPPLDVARAALELLGDARYTASRATSAGTPAPC